MTSPRTEDQTEVRAFLANPASYLDATTAVTPFETHGAVVFVTDTKAYKLKKAVAFPYMDYGTLSRRAEMCAREVDFNRRTAPEIYLRAVPVTRQPGGDLQIGGSGPVVDWLVEMNRFDPTEVLSEKATRGEVDSALILRLVDKMADFHDAAESVPDVDGFAALQGVALGNDGQFAAFADTLPRAMTERLTTATLAALKQHAPQLRARAKAGTFKHCHGDLHLGNICMYHGGPLIFDCIEFNDAFAVIDTLYDTAFLLMDLDARGLGVLARQAEARYLARMDEANAKPLLPVLCSLRAAIRSHVSVAIAHGIADAGVKAGFVQAAHGYLTQALGYLMPAEAVPALAQA
jgi:aminoglycoside phosphotransferase family enzyme